MILIAFISNSVGVYIFAKIIFSARESLYKERYKESRQSFILAHDSQYGELIIPEGSLVNRNDPFDSGKSDEPFSLRGLKAVRFSHPVKIAGIWATAVDVNQRELELAEDQYIGPIGYYKLDPKTQQQTKWFVDKDQAKTFCPQGAIAKMEVPSIAYDAEKEFGKPEPDGMYARFRPSEWSVKDCIVDTWITVKPKYNGKLP